MMIGWPLHDGRRCHIPGGEGELLVALELSDISDSSSDGQATQQSARELHEMQRQAQHRSAIEEQQQYANNPNKPRREGVAPGSGMATLGEP